MSHEDVEKRRQERTRLKRKSTLGTSYGVNCDIVAMFQHNTPVSSSNLRFVKHVPTESKVKIPVYTVRTEESGSQNVITIGNEVNSIEEGFDYAVAIVDKTTGAITYRPALLYNFQTEYAPEPEYVIGTRKPPFVDYSQNYAINLEDQMAKKNLLTNDFGSVKKMKTQEAALKRSINDATLEAMLKTAFASTSVLNSKEEIKRDQISLISKAQSAILPLAVQAELPRDIYPISLFISSYEIESFHSIASEYLSVKRADLITAGFPEIIAKFMPSSVNNDPERCVSFVLLGCMTYFIILLGKGKSLTKKSIDETPFPEGIVQKVLVDYLSTEFDRGVRNKSQQRVQISSQQKERLVAHTLALCLTLNPSHSLPINSWQQQIKLPPSFIERILSALGCDIVQCSVDEAVKTGSMRAARLLRPPSNEIRKGPRALHR